MNLGVVYIHAALVILAAGLALGAIATLAWLLAKQKRVLASTLLFGAWVIGLPAGAIGLAMFHHPLFSTWHRLQNEAVPTSGCVSYEPSFWQFYAVYEMDPPTLDAWVASHPWGLTQTKPAAGIFELHDGPHFGLTSCQAAYESPIGPTGNCLRVYYQNGRAYLSYSAM